MMVSRCLRPVLGCWLLAAVFAANVGYGLDVDFGDMVNKAGRQRMLTQRITKSYLQVGLGANPESSIEQLRDAIALFESQHAFLVETAPNEEVRAGLAAVEELWVGFRVLATSQADLGRAASIIKLDDPLLSACERVAQLVEAASDQGYARLVNISGRQRMLSQRIAKLYMIRASGLGTPSTQVEMDKARNEFSGALAMLRAAPENTPTLSEQLERASEQWLWLESALTMQEDAFYPLIVDDASEKILLLMERITDLYAE